MHNDSFMAPSANYGTYTTFSALTEAQNRTYVAAMQSVPMGGESSTSGDSTNSPRCWLTRKVQPRSACAAVAPRQTSTRGFRTSISASSHGRQAAISRALGFL